MPQEGGVSALGAAFYINELMELRDSLHSDVEAKLTSSLGSDVMSNVDSDANGVGPGTRWDTSVGKEIDKPHQPMCPLHEGNELQLYCESCDKVLCVKCALRQHTDHKCELVEDVVGKLKHVMIPLKRKVNDLAGKMKTTLTTVDMRNEEVGNLRTSIEEDIHTVFQNFRETLCAREAELVQQLDNTVARKLKDLAAERDAKETILVRANGYLQQMEEALNTKSDNEVLQLKKTLMQRLEEIVSVFREDPNIFKVSTEADVVFSVPPDFAPQCKELGYVLTPDSLVAQKCVAKGDGLEAACIDKKAIAIMEVQDLRGNPYLKAVPEMECKVIFVRTGRTTECEVQNETENVYKISYTPVERGAHEVHIKIDGVHIQGSPFPVVVRSSVEKLGKLTTVVEEMVEPWDVVVNQKEQIIVSECSLNRVTIFERDGKKIRSFGRQGFDGKPLKHPRGIALDGKGNIFVADTDNHRVVKFNEQGQLLASGGTAGNGQNQFRDPKGLAFNFVNNKVYVADVHRVQVMNSDLTFADSLGKQGYIYGKLSDAFCIACDNRGNVYVGDRANKNIQMFAPDGQFLRTFLSRGKSRGPGKADLKPVGLAVDANGLVYISDNNVHRVLVFSPDGVCVREFGKQGYASGEFTRPRGLAITEEGVVYVCDFSNDRVQVF